MTPAPSTVGLAPPNGHAHDPQGVSGPKAKKRRVSPTLRSIWELKKRGAMYAVVERRVPMPGYITKDLFGCLDIIAVDDQPGVLGIQATSVANQAARYLKVAQEPRAARWVAAGNRLEVWGWARKWALDSRGRRRRLWVVTVTPYRPEKGQTNE